MGVALSALSPVEDESLLLPLAGGGASFEPWAKLTNGRLKVNKAIVTRIILIVERGLITCLADIINVDSRNNGDNGVGKSGQNNSDQGEGESFFGFVGHS